MQNYPHPVATSGRADPPHKGEGKKDRERELATLQSEAQFAKATSSKSNREGCHAHHSILRCLEFAILRRAARGSARKIPEPSGEVRGELRGRRLQRHYRARAVRLALRSFRPAVRGREPSRRQRQCRRGLSDQLGI